MHHLFKVLISLPLSKTKLFVMCYGTNLCVGSLRVIGLHEVKGLILPISQLSPPLSETQGEGMVPS